VIYDGAVAVDADRILAAGPSRDVLARYPGAAKVDGSGKAVMPGFANVHTHLNMTLARGVYEDLSPPHRPPFTSGLAPLPLPPLEPEELKIFCQLRSMCTAGPPSMVMRPWAWPLPARSCPETRRT
jgi:5-methylthioadenosine/S-adenosylhomocysteine deaminase